MPVSPPIYQVFELGRIFSSFICLYRDLEELKNPSYLIYGHEICFSFPGEGESFNKTSKILSPILFLLYTGDDYPSMSNSTIYVLADDWAIRVIAHHKNYGGKELASKYSSGGLRLLCLLVERRLSENVLMIPRMSTDSRWKKPGFVLLGSVSPVILSGWKVAGSQR